MKVKFIFVFLLLLRSAHKHTHPHSTHTEKKASLGRKQYEFIMEFCIYLNFSVKFETMEAVRSCDECMYKCEILN